jgi:hypothetical protein
MEARDPGGMGDMTVYGNVNGDQVMVTRVVVDDGSGEGLLTFVDNRLDTFTHGGLTLKFVYAADGSVSLESTQSVSRAASDDCQEAVKNEIKNVIRDYDKNNTKIRAAVKWLLVGRGVGVYIHSPLRFTQELILSGAADSVYMAALEERSRLEQKMEELAQQYEDCNKNPDPVDPDPDPGDGSTITILISTNVQLERNHFSGRGPVVIQPVNIVRKISLRLNLKLKRNWRSAKYRGAYFMKSKA